MRSELERALQEAVKIIYDLSLTFSEVEIEVPLREEHGDYSSSIPSKLSSKLRISPKEIGERIKNLILTFSCSQYIAAIDVTDSGFINFFLKKEWYINILRKIIQDDYLLRVDLFVGKKAQVEFVSANPTGPLTVAHGRGAVVGDVLVRLLEYIGYKVQKEFYVNNKGGQVTRFAISIDARYRELLGEEVVFPSDGYRGNYVIDIAKKLLEENPSYLKELTLEERIEYFTNQSVESLLSDHKEVLSKMNVEFDKFFYESTLYKTQLTSKVLSILEKEDYLERDGGAIWFKSSTLGDDKDRVLIKSDGSPTYFASDITYHYDKFVLRGFDLVIDVWGADHHSHVLRMKNSLQALGIDPDRLEIILVQFVRLISGGKEISMSKRTGEFVTLRELIDEVGPDVARYLYLIRSQSSHLDFDLDLALKESMANPVYYVQYAYVRAGSVLKQAQIKGVVLRNVEDTNLNLLTSIYEQRVLRHLSLLKEELILSAIRRSPHKLTHISRKLSEAFHEFYHKNRVLDEEEELEQARLLLVLAIRKALELLLSLMGISKPEEM